MRSLVLRWLVIFLAVLLAAYLFPERVTYASPESAALFAGILALLNIFLRPILQLLAAPLSCLTFGLFALVVNGFVFWLATQAFAGVRVGSFLDAIIAAVVVSVVSFVVSRLFQ
ncbi:MAG: phage holin family protein [Chloroflexota bacterium]